MNENEKIILNNLVVGETFKDFEDLISYLLHHQCDFNYQYLNIVLKEMLNNLNGDEVHILRYQIIFNALFRNRNLNKVYRSPLYPISGYEVIRQLAYLLPDHINQYLSGVLDIKIGIVEVNKRGLKIKHFAYDNQFQIGENVYIQDLNPNNIYYVSDYYEVSLKNLLPYILYVSSEYVYHFNIGVEEIAKESIRKLCEKAVCRVQFKDESALCYIEIPFYIGMVVDCVIGNVHHVGNIEEEVFFYEEDDVKGQVVSAVRINVPSLMKERRFVDEEVAHYFGFSYTDFINFLNQPTRKNKHDVLAFLGNMISLITDEKKLNMIEDINLYYRPLINYLLIKYDPNTYYYQNEHNGISLLSFFIFLERVRENILGFLLDKPYDYLINTVAINVNGRIKYGFAYDEHYTVGEPVFIYLDSQYHIGFIHEVKAIPLMTLIKDIAFYISGNITSIKTLNETLIQKSQIDNYHIIVRVKDDQLVRYAIIKNYIPFVGEVLSYQGKQYVVLEEPRTIDKDLYDYDDLLVLEY